MVSYQRHGVSAAQLAHPEFLLNYASPMRFCFFFFLAILGFELRAFAYKPGTLPLEPQLQPLCFQYNLFNGRFIEFSGSA